MSMSVPAKAMRRSLADREPVAPERGAPEPAAQPEPAVPAEPAPAPIATAPTTVSVAPEVDRRREATAKLTLESLLRSTPAPPTTGELQPVGDGAIALSIQEILYLRTDRLMENF